MRHICIEKETPTTAAYITLKYADGTKIGIGFSVSDDVEDHSRQFQDMFKDEIFFGLYEKCEKDNVHITKEEKQLIYNLLNAYFFGFENGRSM